MIDGKNLNELKKEEKEKWNSLDKKQKWGYFKDYYLWKVIVLLVVIAAGISIFLETVVLWKDPIYSGCIMNFELAEEGESFLTTEYYDYLGGGKKKYMPKVTVCYVDYGSTEQVMDSNKDSQILYAQFATKDYHYILMTDYSLEGIEYLDVYADLREVLNPEWSSILEGRILGAMTERQEDPMPAVIDISGTEAAEKLGFLEDKKLYLAFAVNTSDVENTNRFLDYLLSDLKAKGE